MNPRTMAWPASPTLQAHREADGEDEHRMRRTGPGPRHLILQFQDVLLQVEKQ